MVGPGIAARMLRVDRAVGLGGEWVADGGRYERRRRRPRAGNVLHAIRWRDGAQSHREKLRSMSAAGRQPRVAACGGRERWGVAYLQQQCCGSESPMDYRMSYWYKMNRERGTISFVPPSCCKQTQIARAPNVDSSIHIQPIDSLCITYPYNTTAFKDAVHQQVSSSNLFDKPFD